MKGIYVPEKIARTIVDSLNSDLERTQEVQREQIGTIQQRLTTVRSRMDQIYEDKLDGKITEEFWTRKQAGYRDQESALESQLSRVSVPVSPDSLLTVERIFELANKAHFLYLARNNAANCLNRCF